MKIQTAELIRSAHEPEAFIHDGRPAIAFVGRSNVGKSSLLNRLLGRRKLARISSTPGRTRSVNYYLVDQKFYFVDLPGYGYAKARRAEQRRWARAAELYLEQESGAPSRVVLLVDGYVGATPLDVQALRYLEDIGADVVVAATKIDRVGRSRRQRKRREIEETLELPDETPLVAVSARTGEGLSELWREIAVK